ncbi:hypothetical protein NFI96_000029 [Prochilodus magdalenae]|nr:hypothetical protein NFI96_000029 [Prochilodus magdalenae]
MPQVRNDQTTDDEQKYTKDVKVAILTVLEDDGGAQCLLPDVISFAIVLEENVIVEVRTSYLSDKHLQHGAAQRDIRESSSSDSLTSRAEIDNMADTEDFGDIEVIFQDEEEKRAPQCPHGPTVLFEIKCKGGENGRRFYACSACRDRKECSFFQWEDEKVSEARLLAREQQNRSKLPPFTHVHYCARFREYASLPLDQRRFCVNCQILLLPEEWTNHASHQMLNDITVSQLRRPSLLLRPLENKKSNAQYLFADRSCHFLLNVLSGLGFRKVLCVGTPRNDSSSAAAEFVLVILHQWSQDAAHRTLPTGRCPQDAAHRTLPTGRCPQDVVG